MPDTEQEAQWRKQFEANGREAVLIFCREGSISGQMRNFAYQWLKEIDDAREMRDAAGHWYLKRTYIAAVAAVVVGVVGVLVGIISVVAARYWH
jgi:hypothetical protein